MNYQKAMKHARNVRKCRKQSRMHFGFDSFSGKVPAGNEIAQIKNTIWHMFNSRHSPARTPENKIWLRQEVKKYIQHCKELMTATSE